MDHAVHRPSWLCPDPASRARLMDMDTRLRRPRAIAFAILGVALLASIPDYGVWPLGLLIVAVTGFLLVSAVQARLTAPEHGMVASWVLSQLVLAVAVALTGGVDSHAVSWFIIPLVVLPARFGLRGVMAGLSFTVGLVAVVAVVSPAAQQSSEILGVLFPVAALGAVAVLSTALLTSDLEHRSEAVIDALTGMLNRRALDHRLGELTAQAAVTGEPIAVIAADVDHFKDINDRRGHGVGDAVLIDVAYRLRKRLRAFDLAYRMGGEEFLVVLPGASLAEAAALAEELRTAVADEPIAAEHVTLSFGVAGSGGGVFDGPAVIRAADEALYAAKAAGRDRVVADAAAVLA